MNAILYIRVIIIILTLRMSTTLKLISIVETITKQLRILPYPCERGPMGGAPYIGPRLGDGPIFEVSVLCLYAKERPGKLPTLAS